MRFFLIVFLFLNFSAANAQEIPADVVQVMDRLKKKESRYWNDQDWENHMRICHEFLVNYEQYLTESEKASWNVKIAGTFIQLKSYLLAVEYLHKGIAYGDDRLKSFAFGQLGRSYIDLGDYDKALKSYSDAIQYAQEPGVIVAHTNSKGFVYFKASRYQEARATYDKALELFSQNSAIDSIQYRIIQSNLASVDFEQGLTSSALERLYALERAFRPRYTWFHTEVYSKMIPALLEKGECAEAERALVGLQESLEDTPVSEARLVYLEYRIKQAQLCNGSRLAKYQQEYFHLNEALKQQNIDRLLIIEKLQRDELKKRLKLVSDNLKLKKESERQYRKLVIVSVSLLVLVLIGAFLWWRTVKSRQRRKEKYLQLREELMRESEKSAELKREMDAKELVNKKLELKQMLQSMNNNATLLEEIQGRLSSLRNKEDGIQESITDLIHFLKSHAGAQAINDVIEQNVEMIGGDFRDRFFEKHGEFTPSEIQLVLLLRIGLSTKEMALMKSVEPSSIRIFKHRLKAKLGLEKGQDLTSYIQNF